MSRSFLIRQATIADVDAIHELHTKSVKVLCKEYYTDKQIAGWLKHHTPEDYLSEIVREELFVAMEEEYIIGFGHARPGKIVAIFVDPEHTRHRVGRALLFEGITRARSGNHKTIQLESTLNEQSFFEQVGFVEIERKAVMKNDVALSFITMELKIHL